MQIISSDLLRGHIDAFVLSALMKGEKYGAEIKNCIAKKSKNLYVPNEQSLYSAYHRLERDGFIKGKWGDENVGVKRKYYTITEDGVRYFRSLKGEWQNAKILLDILMNEELWNI